MYIHVVIDTPTTERYSKNGRVYTRVRCVRGRIEARHESLIHVWAGVAAAAAAAAASHDYVR